MKANVKKSASFYCQVQDVKLKISLLYIPCLVCRQNAPSC